MFLIVSAVALIVNSLRYHGDTPAALRIALVANAIALILDAAGRIRRMKRGEHYAEDP